MAGPVIRLGNKTAHGGTVIEASTMSDSGGIGIARMGDKTTCPPPGHGTTPIVSGGQTCIMDGKPVARHGDKNGCGAALIAGQQNTIDQL